ncbi:WD repeat-containing protein 34 isoform X2 [Orussus abietinus]|nr:WD repeat-containing protein 34 isoform X2 [Orussus abietinus]
METQTVSERKEKVQIDYQKLAAFLKRVTPGVLVELDEAYGSSAFDNYEPSITDSESTTTIRLSAKVNISDDSTTKIKINDLAWSIGGGVLASCHGIPSHSSWCDHLSKIEFFNLTRDDQFVETPSKVLELNACVTLLAYHPTEPSVVAAGLFNGDVLLWNLRDEFSVTPLQVCTHGDSISSIYWQTRNVNNVPLLVTASTDGFIYVHKLMANFTIVKLHKRFKVAKEHNPSESARPRSAGGKRERAIEAGLSITCLDFSTKDTTLFIVGTLCGGLYKCSEVRAIPIEENESILDPVIDEYTRHAGSVTCIRCSSLHNLFISSGADKEIRIFDIEQSSHQHVIIVEETVVGLKWFPGNPDLFCTYGAGPVIRFYNVTNGKSIPNLKLESSDRYNTSCLSFNPKRDMVALGDTSGNVEIWKIPSRLSSLSLK